MSQLQEKDRFEKTLVQKILGYFGFTLKPRNKVTIQVIRNGKPIKTLWGYAFNSRVDAGAAWQKENMAGTPGNAALYIALSEDTLSPAKGDTTLSNEISTGGLSRALGALQNYTAPSTLDGAASYEVYKSFTASASFTVASAAIFDAASTGNMFVEANLGTSASVVSGDVIQVTWTVNL